LLGRLRRSASQRVKDTPMQIRIDTGSWSMKSKLAKIAIGKVWAKNFHTEAILGVKAKQKEVKGDRQSIAWK
jgi:hypothetical protein